LPRCLIAARFGGSGLRPAEPGFLAAGSDRSASQAAASRTVVCSPWAGVLRPSACRTGGSWLPRCLIASRFGLWSPRARRLRTSPVRTGLPDHRRDFIARESGSDAGGRRAPGSVRKDPGFLAAAFDSSLREPPSEAPGPAPSGLRPAGPASPLLRMPHRFAIRAPKPRGPRPLAFGLQDRLHRCCGCLIASRFGLCSPRGRRPQAFGLQDQGSWRLHSTVRFAIRRLKPQGQASSGLRPAGPGFLAAAFDRALREPSSVAPGPGSSGLRPAGPGFLAAAFDRALREPSSAAPGPAVSGLRPAEPGFLAAAFDSSLREPSSVAPRPAVSGLRPLASRFGRCSPAAGVLRPSA